MMILTNINTKLMKLMSSRQRIQTCYWLSLGLVALMGLYGQSTSAACPVVNSLNDVENVNTSLDVIGQTIYFCKQDFTEANLTYQPTPTDLVNGGSQVIAQGDLIQSFPLSNTINLSGFTPDALALNTLSTNIPTSDGQYNVMSLFNFYSQVSTWNNSCLNYNATDQFVRITDYLRANPGIFQVSSQGQTNNAIAANTGDDVATIEDVVIGHDAQSGSELTADITFYHANAGMAGQWFTRGTVRYCWVGIGARMVIDTNNSNLTHSGDYTGNMSVLTQ